MMPCTCSCWHSGDVIFQTRKGACQQDYSSVLLLPLLKPTFLFASTDRMRSALYDFQPADRANAFFTVCSSGNLLTFRATEAKDSRDSLPKRSCCKFKENKCCVHVRQQRACVAMRVVSFTKIQIVTVTLRVLETRDTTSLQRVQRSATHSPSRGSSTLRVCWRRW